MVFKESADSHSQVDVIHNDPYRKGSPMPWSIKKTLTRTGVPAVTMFVGMTGFQLYKAEQPAREIIEGNLYLYLLIWIVLAVFFFALSRLYDIP
jgi:vancomycin permeability regulator SanA